MIAFADGFFTELDDARIVAVDGRLGAGKTMLAFQLAQRYLDRGYRLLTNVLTVWGDPWDEVQVGRDGRVRAVVLVDEGGLYLRSMESVSMLSSFARKLDLYIIISGKRLPHEELCELVVSPFFDMRRNLGIPIWWWRWQVHSTRRYYGGYLAEVGRSGFHGVYDTVDPGEWVGGLLDKTVGLTATLFEAYGRSYQLSDVGRSGGEHKLAAAVDEAGVVARKIREDLALLAEQKRGRRVG